MRGIPVTTTSRRASGRLSLIIGVVAALLVGIPASALAADAPLGNDTVAAIEPAATGATGGFSTPTDATPNAQGTTIYFTASGETDAGVFAVAADGGTVTPIATGAPFVAPLGVALAIDDATIYVADPKAEGKPSWTGQIFALPTAGGAPAALRGSAGTAPRALDVVSTGDGDRIFFVGVDPVDGAPALMTLPATGADAPTVLAKGAPLTQPVGLTVSETGVAYVVDEAAAGAEQASVLRIVNGVVTRVIDGFRAGDPAGIALTLDETILLVSARDADDGTARILLVDLATGETGVVTKVIGTNPDAGGLHRARDRNVFAWCGVTAGGGGTVYSVALE